MTCIFLIAAIIAQIFNANAELVILMGISIKAAKEEIETHPVIVETKIRKCSIQFRVVQTFLCFLLINLLWFISSIKYFLVLSIYFNLNSWLMFSSPLFLKQLQFFN